MSNDAATTSPQAPAPAGATSPRTRGLTTYIVLWRDDDGLHELEERPEARSPEAAIEKVDGPLSTQEAQIAVAIPASSYHVFIQRSAWSKAGV